MTRLAGTYNLNSKITTFWKFINKDEPIKVGRKINTVETW